MTTPPYLIRVDFYPNNNFVHWTLVNIIFALIKDRRIHHHSNHNLCYYCYLRVVINVDIIMTGDNLIIGQLIDMKCYSILKKMMTVFIRFWCFYNIVDCDFIMVI